MNTGGGNTTNNADADLERRINAVFDALLAAPSRDEAQVCALRMAELIGKRSPQRVAEMERERGLRA
jgi:hypothetical protein